MEKRRSRFAAWRTRIADRLAESSQVFLIGLVVACGVEVLVDWNQTLTEINVLRDQVRLKGLNYAGLLVRAAVDPVQNRELAALDRLTTGIIDDEDAVFVRIVDPAGQVVYDRIDEQFAQRYLRQGKGDFVSHYQHWLLRDLKGILFDPEGFRQRLASSRYRDLPQMYSDLMASILSHVVDPPPLPPLRAQVIYQDRLRDENHHRDNNTTWALAPLLADTPSGARKVGAVLVAFDMSRANQAIRNKYLKGIGMVIFFLALILAQNVSARRDKLRLLDVGRRYAAAKRALHDAMETELVDVASEQGALLTQGAIDQAKESVDGMVWDALPRDGKLEVLIADPDGDGIDAAAIGLHILRTFRIHGGQSSLEDELIRLGAATNDIPLTRPIGLLLLRVQPDGSFAAIREQSISLWIWNPRDKSPLTPLPGEQLGTPIPDGIIGPLWHCQGILPVSATLLCLGSGKGVQSHLELEPAALAKQLQHHPLRLRDEGALDGLIHFLRSKNPRLVDNDISVVAIARSGSVNSK